MGGSLNLKSLWNLEPVVHYIYKYHMVILQVMVLGSIDLLIPLEVIKHHI